MPPGAKAPRARGYSRIGRIDDGVSTLLLIPWAYATGDLMPRQFRVGRLEIHVVLMGIVGTTSLLRAFHVIATACAVFYSQCAYAMDIAGVFGGMLLLNEEFSLLAWLAFPLSPSGVVPARNNGPFGRHGETGSKSSAGTRTSPSVN